MELNRVKLYEEHRQLHDNMGVCVYARVAEIKQEGKKY